MKRYVRTPNYIFDTYRIRKNLSCYDKDYNVENYYDCDGKLIVIEMFGCEPIERKAYYLGIIMSQSDKFEDLLTDKDFVEDKYVYIKSGNDYKRVAYYHKDGLKIL